MEEKINSDFEDFQKVLEKKEKRLKIITKFDVDDDVEKNLEELKNKEVVL